MYSQGLLSLIPILALSARAAPVDISRAAPLATRDDETFNIHVHNNCTFQKEIGIYGVSSAFQMESYITPTTIPAGGQTVVQAPFHGVGLRLSGHAELGLAGQWLPQALFEFGYSAYDGAEGTAYDLSLMQGSDMDISMAAYPIDNGDGSNTCESKICYPWAPTATGCWTNPDQADEGSPADTVCYKGKTDFKVVYCAS